jgi:HlyD family secretion protein
LARIIVVVLVIAGGAAGIWYFTRPQPVAVTLYTVDRGPVTQTVSNTRVGTVKACRRALLAPAAGGEVSALNVREGDTVQAGDLLLEIWNEDIKAQVRLARAELVASQARIEEACTAAAGAKREADRLTALRKDRLVAEEQADIAQTDADARAASCAAARASYQVAQAQIELSEAALDRTQVLAPFDGYVAEVNAEIGEYVTPSPPGIATLPAVDLINADCLYVSAPIDEVDAPAIRLGMPACVTLDAFDERRCSGFVRRIAPYVLEAEKQARTVEVEVELKDPADLKDLLPGYSADIEVVLDRNDAALRIPSEAVLEGNRVFVLDPLTGRLAERRITAGLANWDFTEVREGLREGERVVLSVGRDGVEDGALATAEPGKGSEKSP